MTSPHLTPPWPPASHPAPAVRLMLGTGSRILWAASTPDTRDPAWWREALRREGRPWDGQAWLTLHPHGVSYAGMSTIYDGLLREAASSRELLVGASVVVDTPAGETTATIRGLDGSGRLVARVGAASWALLMGAARDVGRRGATVLADRVLGVRDAA